MEKPLRAAKHVTTMLQLFVMLLTTLCLLAGPRMGLCSVQETDRLPQARAGRTPPPTPQAVARLKADASQGKPIARLKLAWCAWMGQCTVGDNAALQSPRHIIDALRQEQFARAHYAAWLMERRSQQGSASGRAQLALDQALAANDALALNVQAIALARAQQTARALALFQQAAAGGSLAAPSNLDTLRRQANNQSSRQDIAALMERTNQKNSQAMFELAMLHHKGEGLPFNQSEAIRLYSEAARLGYAPAQRMLGLLLQKGGPHLQQLTPKQFQELARIDMAEPVLRVKPFVPSLLLIDEDPLIGLEPAQN